MYIRTKNRIYKVESILRDNGFVKGYNVGEMAFIRKDQVINQSENLEELCDEFVGLIKDRSSDFIITKVIAHSLKELKDSLKTEFNGKIYQGHYDITYGAIWTSKGLIYVAKMNESGELELIWQK